MKLPGSASEIKSGLGRAQGQARRVEYQTKRAKGVTDRASAKSKATSKSPAESPAESEPKPPKQSKHPKQAKQPRSTPVRSAVQFAVVGVIGAIGAALLGLAVANTDDDRLLFSLIGVPLGALLAVGVVASFHWAGLVERPD